MQTSVTFKNLDPSENLKSYISGKLDKFDKFLDNPAMATVVLSVEKFRHIAEINIVGDRLKINGKEETNDMYSSMDMVLDKLEKQIKKNKQKTKDHRSNSKSKKNNIEDTTFSDYSPEDQIFVKYIDYKPMDVDEAIEQMDLTNQNFIVFTNATTDRVNVIYVRHDGSYGLIKPS